MEASGFASLWVSDHVVMPATVTSRYPYASDGVATWATDEPWYDSIVALAMAAAVTESVELGTAVLVLPQRQPVVLAKQVASLDRLAGGRVVLGVGAGWLAEEFAALATPFEARGRAPTSGSILLRSCWTGRPDAFDGAHYRCRPTSSASRHRPVRSRSSSAGRRRRRCDGPRAAATAGSASSRPTPSTSPRSRRRWATSTASSVGWTAATSTTAIAPPACSACWPPASRSSSASWSSSPSRATTPPAAGAETEALTVAQQIETAQFFPPAVAAELTGELVCYARSVAGVQWERMESGTLGEQVNPWGVELFRTMRAVEPETATEQSAYDKWLDQTSDARAGPQRPDPRCRRGDPDAAVVGAVLQRRLIFVFMLFFADSGERRSSRRMLMGTVVAVITSMLLLLYFLDHPFHDGIGGLRPVAMERTLEIIDQELTIAEQDGTAAVRRRGKPACRRRWTG